MVLTVFCYIVFYSCVYFYLEARISGLLLLIGCVLLTPLILKLEKHFPNAARMAFCFSCLFYIYATPFGIRFPMDIEYYYLAALMIPAVLYNPNQKIWILVCMAMCPSVWAFQIWGPMPEFSIYWVPAQFPHEIFKIINFLGATLIMIVFLKHFVDEFYRHSTEMRKTLKELDQFFNVALDVLCIAGLDGKFKKTNTAFSKLLGYMPDELISRSLIEFVHPDDVVRTQEAINQLRQGIPVKDFTNRYRASDGSYKVLSWSTSPDPEMGLVYAAGRDITDLVAAEGLAKSEKAKALLNAKLASLGEMSAGIAHEINNPLMTISGSAQMMERSLDDRSKIQQLTTTILRATERVTKIINGLRKFSHCSEAIEYKPLGLGQILKESLVLVGGKANKFRTELRVKSQTESQILCNEVEIEQVLINLISNSIDAVKSSEERWVHLHLFDEDQSVVLQVKDSGKGIPEKVAEKIFQPFFTTKQVGEGTGLGLSIVRGILEEHGATIELLRDNQHTCFEIRFKKVH